VILLCAAADAARFPSRFSLLTCFDIRGDRNIARRKPEAIDVGLTPISRQL